MTSKIETYEVFRYKVVYPGGTYLRISPAIDAERTGIVLEFGTVFDASKSLFLDGVNYAKVSHGNGWVFEKKDDVQILELLQIIRVPVKKVLEDVENCAKQLSTENLDAELTSTITNSVAAQLVHIPLTGNRAGAAVLPPSDRESDESCVTHYTIPSQRHTKVENRLWRDVRARCGACATFDQFLQLVTVLKISIDGLHAQHEQRVLNSINLIASITGQCSAQVVKDRDCTRGVDVSTCLWVLVHMGSRVSHTMSLIVEAANLIFETASTLQKAHLLRVVLEVGNRTKTHAADLGRQVDILPDDIRNFLQRWIIVQSYEEKNQLVPVNLGDNIFSSEGNAMNEMAYSFNEDESATHKAPNTPVGRSKLYSRQSSMWPSSLSNGLSLSFSSWFERDGCSSSASSSSSFLPYCGNQSFSSEFNNSRDNPRYSDPITHKIDRNSGMDGPSSSSSQGDGLDDTALRTISSILWNAVARHVEKLSDTDMQLAGLI